MPGRPYIELAGGDPDYLETEGTGSYSLAPTVRAEQDIGIGALREEPSTG